MPDKDKEKEEEKKSTLQEKLDALEVKDLAIKNITARIKTNEPNNNYKKPPSKLRLVGLKKI